MTINLNEKLVAEYKRKYGLPSLFMGNVSNLIQLNEELSLDFEESDNCTSDDEVSTDGECESSGDSCDDIEID